MGERSGSCLRLSCYSLLAATVLAICPPAGGESSEDPEFTPEQRVSAQWYKTMVEAASASQPPNASALDRLVTGYERLVELYCMPGLRRTLQYSGNPSNADCLNYLSKLDALYPEDPVLACARHGIDSDQCKNAYADQYVDTYTPEKADVSEFELSTKLRADIAEHDIERLSREIEALHNQYQALRKEGPAKLSELGKKKTQLVVAHTRRAHLSCLMVRIKMVRTPISEKKRASARERTNSPSDSLTQLLRRFATPVGAERAAPSPVKAEDFEPFEKPRPVAAPVWRVRYIPKGCDTALDAAAEFDPRLPAAPCNFEGATSPKCIAALRNWRRIEEREGLPRRQDQRRNGFSMF